MDLHSARSSNGFGANALSWTEIKAYLDLYQIEPQEWELDLIKQFDMQAMKAFAKAAEVEKSKTK